MNCQEARPYVSALYDGESVPGQAAAHIGSCGICRELLRGYAALGAELRLLASADSEASLPPPAYAPSRGGRWTHGLTARVLVPRFAVGLVLIALVGLSVGLALVRGQGSGPWFQYEVSGPEWQGTSGNVLQAGESGSGEFSLSADSRITLYEVKVLDVSSGSARIEVRARKFNTETDGHGGKFIVEPGGGRGTVKSRHDIERLLASATPQRFDSKAGEKLQVSVDGGGTLDLTGKVYRLHPSFWGYPVNPEPNEIVLTNPAMVRGQEFLGNIAGSASAAGEGMAIGACVPPAGAFVFALKPFPGAIRGVAEFGRASFTMDGRGYTLFSATPITGGQQPRDIWVYRAPHCPSVSRPMILGSGSPDDFIPQIGK